MVLVGHAVGIHEVGAGAAQLGGTVVHPLHEGVDAAGHGAGDHVAGLVGGGDHGAVEVVLQGHDLAGLDARGAGLLIQTVHAVISGGDLVLEIQLAPIHGLQRQQDGHDLCETGRIGPLIGALGVVDVAGVQVHQQRLPGGELGHILHGQGHGGQYPRQQADCQQD